MPALTSTAQAHAAVTLTWQPNPEADIAGYRIYLGTENGMFSKIHDVGSATLATLAPLVPSTTYYCAVQAYDTEGLASDLSATISFTTESVATLFSTWAKGAGLRGSAAVPAATPFTDGVPNLLKYAFNINAAGAAPSALAKGAGTAGLPVFTLVRRGSQTWFEAEFLRRKGSGLVYAPKLSTDLVTYTTMTGTTTITSISDEWERVIIQQACNLAITTRLFGRVEVTLPGITVGPEITVIDSTGKGMTDATSTLSFSSASLGSSDSIRTITLSNTGSADLTGLAVILDGTNAADFNVSAPGATTLAPGAGTTLTVTFRPTTPGTRNAAIHIASSDPVKASFDIALTGNGVAAAVLFNTWAADRGLSGATATPTATPFQDGVPNLLKYAFNLSAVGPDRRLLTASTGTVGLPVFALDRGGSQAWFKVEFLRRKGSGLVYTPKVSTNLVTYTAMSGTTTITTIDDAWERVTMQQPCNLAGTPYLFGRVEVTLP